MPWKVHSTKDVYESKWMRLTEDEVETDFGKRLTYNVLHRDDFSLVIPWDGEKFVLVGQYRYPTDSYSWEFPMGSAEEGSPDVTATRELAEETGMTAGAMRKLGVFYVANGHCTQACHAYLATDLAEGEQHLDVGEEGMEVKRLSFAELSEMMNDGTIKDGPSMAATTFRVQYVCVLRR